MSPCGPKDVNLDFDFLWAPSHQQVVAIEMKIKNYIKSIEYRGLPLPELHRQYAGFTRENKSYTYGNFYTWSLQRGEEDAFDPIITCDGGSHYWTIVFDIKEFRFLGLHYNGAF